jgi:uncharacterized protein YaaQ
MTDQPTPEKLLIIVVSPNDGELLMQRLVRDGVPATRVGSTGGFLSRGSSTIISGVPASQVEPVLDLIRQICPVRTELAPVQTLPLVGTAATGPPIEVRIGGAIVFVLDIERFERI